MRYKIEIEENYVVLRESEDGQKLQEIFRELSSQSMFSIILEKKELFAEDELITLHDQVNDLEDNYGILIAVGSEKFRNTLEAIGSESIIWLPTKDEAVEAVYMNELESQFRKELDQE